MTMLVQSSFRMTRGGSSWSLVAFRDTQVRCRGVSSHSSLRSRSEVSAGLQLRILLLERFDGAPAHELHLCTGSAGSKARLKKGLESLPGSRWSRRSRGSLDRSRPFDALDARL